VINLQRRSFKDEHDETSSLLGYCFMQVFEPKSQVSNILLRVFLGITQERTHSTQQNVNEEPYVPRIRLRHALRLSVQNLRSYNKKQNIPISHHNDD
jgi:hypothetical protein